MRYSDFDLYKDLLMEKTGLYLSADQSWVLDSRLLPIARKWGYPGIASMTVALRGIADPGLIKDVIEAVVTQDTAFFRHPEHFTPILDDVLPHLAAMRKPVKKLRIWSAGCGTGQEPYSIAMFLKDRADLLGGIKVEIIATDICSSALEQAQKAEYGHDDIQRGLSIHHLLDHFDQKGTRWKLNKDITKMVTFKYGNLLDSLVPMGEFDMIFCCNVLDGFAHGLRQKTLANIRARLAPDGILFVEPREILDS